MGIGEGAVAAHEGGVELALGIGGHVVDDKPVYNRAVGIVHGHGVGAFGQVGDHRVGVLPQGRGAVGLGVEGPQETGKFHGFKGLDLIGLNALHLAEFLIGVIGSQGRPVVVGVEINILRVVLFQVVKGGDGADARVHLSVHIVDGRLLIAAAHVIQHRLVQHDPRADGADHHVEVYLVLHVGVDLVHGGGELICRGLSEVIQPVAAVAGDIHLPLHFPDLADGAVGQDLLRLRRQDHFLRGSGIRDVVSHHGLPYDLIRPDAVELLHGLAAGDEPLPHGIGIGVPGVDGLEVAAVPEGGQGEFRKLCQGPLFHLRGIRPQKPQKADDAHDQQGQAKAQDFHPPGDAVYLPAFGFCDRHRPSPLRTGSTGRDCSCPRPEPWPKGSGRKSGAGPPRRR